MKRLGELLVDAGHVSPAQVEEALSAKGEGERLGETLMRLGYVSEEAVAQAVATQVGLPFRRLEGAQQIAVEVLSLVPPKLAFGRRFIPLEKFNSTLRIAVADPLDLDLLEELRVLVHLEIDPHVAPASQIERAIRAVYGVGADEVDRMLAGAREEIEVLHDQDLANADAAKMAEDASLIKFVNQVILEAVRDRASDVHVEPQEKELRIRYRVDGVLHVTPVPPQIKRFQPAIVSRLKIMSGLNIAEKRLPQDGSIRLKALAREIDIRVSIIPGIHGEGVVLRLLDRENMRFGLEDLGMPDNVRVGWEKLITEPHGILLVTGPTGSGKTTTLYAALQKINSPVDKIITVEDPVEYQLEGIQQIQVHTKIGLTFASSLRSILRHDPDIILVGEIRDLETAEIAVQASLTGHLVLSTLHTNDAPSALTRLVDMGVEPYLVSSTVEAVMAQRLVRRICASCTEEVAVDALLRPLVPEDIRTYKRGRGCEPCRKMGYRGRVGLFELMFIDDATREMITHHEAASQVKRRALDRGMITLRASGWSRVREGVTTPEEVLRMTKEDRA